MYMYKLCTSVIPCGHKLNYCENITFTMRVHCIRTCTCKCTCTHVCMHKFTCMLYTYCVVVISLAEYMYICVYCVIVYHDR